MRPGDGERFRTLLEINNAIISNLTREALFHAIAQTLQPVLPFDRAAIFLHDPTRNVLRLFVLESSLPTSYFVVGLEMAVGDSHVGRVFSTQQSLLRRDLEQEREYPVEEHALADGVRSYVITPLVVRGRSIGVLAAASATPNRYDAADAGFLQQVANQVALAIENMKAFEDQAAAAERSRTLLEINNAVVSNLGRDALLGAITQALRRVVTFDRISIFLHDPRKDVLRLFALESSLPVGRHVPGFEISKDTHVGWVLEHQRPIVRRDIVTDAEFPSEQRILVDGIRSFVILPLTVRGRRLGTLNVNSVRPMQYSEADGVFLREVANQVALALGNMLAYEEIATLKARLERENAYLQEEIEQEHNFVEMVGSSPALLTVLEEADRVAPTDATVLISGETGTGKELVARIIHNRSRRRNRPLVKVNCGAISAGLVESELFGHVKGAFTGALERRIGRFELADGGTIFLDEVGELPLDTQVKLLRVLQEQEFEPVGSSRALRVDVRVIAATNRNLEQAVRAGHFRPDLFYRLNVFPLEVPALRERTSDIPQLAGFFVSAFARRLGKKVDSVSPNVMERLIQYPWPGNIRELQNVIERAVVLCPDSALELDREILVPPAGHVERVAPGSPPAAIRAAGSSRAIGLDALLTDLQRAEIVAALQQTDGLIEGPKGAARILKLHPNTLRSRMEKLGIKRPGHEAS